MCLLLPLLLLPLLTPCPAAADLSLPAELGVDRWDWQWLDLWPKLLHIRRQFDRDGFPLQQEETLPVAAGGGANTGEQRPTSRDDMRRLYHGCWMF